MAIRGEFQEATSKNPSLLQRAEYTPGSCHGSRNSSIVGLKPIIAIPEASNGRRAAFFHHCSTRCRRNARGFLWTYGPSRLWHSGIRQSHAIALHSSSGKKSQSVLYFFLQPWLVFHQISASLLFLRHVIQQSTALLGLASTATPKNGLHKG